MLMMTIDNILARRAIAEAEASAPVRAPHAPTRVGLKPGSVNIDMDTLADYAGGYGFEAGRTPDPVYTLGLARFLDLFAERGIRATIFVIARDAEVPEHAAILRRAAAMGHEIANHTLTHPRRLSALSEGERRREVTSAHEILSNLAEKPIVGFRAPCYDICPKTMALLRELGYRYDSSVHPSIAAPLIDLAVLLKSRLRRWEVRPGSYAHLLASLRPFRPLVTSPWRKGRGLTGDAASDGLIELPLSALPLSRLPFYGTWAHMTGMGLFRRSIDWLDRFSVPLNFHFHAVELVGLEDAGVDPRFSVHPGMNRGVEEKSTDVAEMLDRFGRSFRLMTLESMAHEIAGFDRRRPRDEAFRGK